MARRTRDYSSMHNARRFEDIQRRLELIELKLGGILLIMTRIFGSKEEVEIIRTKWRGEQE